VLEGLERDKKACGQIRSRCRRGSGGSGKESEDAPHSLFQMRSLAKFSTGCTVNRENQDFRELSGAV
jgi:hypothetical protein